MQLRSAVPTPVSRANVCCYTWPITLLYAATRCSTESECTRSRNSRVMRRIWGGEGRAGKHCWRSTLRWRCVLPVTPYPDSVCCAVCGPDIAYAVRCAVLRTETAHAVLCPLSSVRSRESV
eukprot:1020820-Rhodomonas_salina.1